MPGESPPLVMTAIRFLGPLPGSPFGVKAMLSRAAECTADSDDFLDAFLTALQVQGSKGKAVSRKRRESFINSAGKNVIYWLASSADLEPALTFLNPLQQVLIPRSNRKPFEGRSSTRKLR